MGSLSVSVVIWHTFLMINRRGDITRIGILYLGFLPSVDQYCNLVPVKSVCVKLICSQSRNCLFKFSFGNKMVAPRTIPAPLVE